MLTVSTFIQMTRPPVPLDQFLPGHFVPIAGWVAAAAAHDFVEGFEVRLGFPILKIAGSLQGRKPPP